MIWYQGEANADQLIAKNEPWQYYQVAYEAMIADWRERKGMGDFAVLTMQLPPSVKSGSGASTRYVTYPATQTVAPTNPVPAVYPASRRMSL